MNPELDAAVRAVEALGAPGVRKERPTRHLARPVMILLGEALIAGKTEDAEGAVVRLGALPAPLRGGFEAAVRDELLMACTEHVRSVDPRYLGRPDYDLAYAVSARRSLEARLRAVERLGLPPDEHLLEAVRRADRLLEERNRKR